MSIADVCQTIVNLLCAIGFILNSSKIDDLKKEIEELKKKHTNPLNPKL